MKTINEIISEIDTAVGMLTVPAMSTPLVKDAKEKLIQASIDLGEIGEEIEHEGKLDRSGFCTLHDDVICTGCMHCQL